MANGQLANRWTFYIDKDGKIAHIEKTVQPATSAEDMIAKLGELKVPMSNVKSFALLGSDFCVRVQVRCSGGSSGPALFRRRAKIRSFTRLAGVAQLVEQLIRNQQVTRSSPGRRLHSVNNLLKLLGLGPKA